MTLLTDHTTTLYIAYGGEAGDDLGRQRVEHVIALIRQQWRQAGEPYRLVINTDPMER
ncbi:hypothetical protein N8A98_02065 (plasmid) [Devosia neptuniae]|uniref:Uncharacterized protein n=1 Tax=Devosia neptuniae TaxID=191302 RepID=A0ABY6C7L6_9HYPH|nr:hypothetical protein [Devosia neptuniae]UXN67868.1 hypothetical protein N8A98_02065 [Devosia neptuniae]